MNIEDFLNDGKIPKLNIHKDKLLQVLLLKAIHNDVKLDAILVKLTEIKAMLSDIEDAQLEREISREIKETIDKINEASFEKYAAVLNAISAD